MPANMGAMERIARGLGVHCQSMCGLLRLPLLDQRVDCVNEAVLWDDKVVVGSVEVGMKMVP